MTMDKLRFLYVLMCALLPYAYTKKALSRGDHALLTLCLAGTATADGLILLLGQNTAGVWVFCAVQIGYIARYGLAVARNVKNSKARRRLTATGLTALLLLCAWAVWLYKGTNWPAQTRAACVYAPCLAGSVGFAAAAFIQKAYPFPNKLLILAGMVCFLLCDIHVGLYNLGIGYGWVNLGNIVTVIWLFYAPSQLLLALSALRYVTKR